MRRTLPVQKVSVATGRSCDRRFLCDALFMAKQKEDQRAEIWFCVRSRMSRLECYNSLRAVHGANTLSKSQVNRWFSRFVSDANAFIKDLPRANGGRVLTPTKVNEIRDAVVADRRKTCRQLARETGVSKGSAHTAVRRKLGLRKKSAHWIPHLLNDQQRRRHVQTARRALQFIRQCRRHGNIHVITGDESWFWVWMPEQRQSTCQWLPKGRLAGPRPTKVRIERSTRKAMLVVFFDCQGLVYREWVPNGHGISAQVYLQIVQRLRDAVCRRRPQVWRTRNWALLQDNAPAHNSNPVQNYLQQHQISLVPHPGYSPDISPPDYWLFNKIKSMTRGHRYHNLQDMMTAVDQAIGQIPQAEWADAMQHYPVRLRHLIQSNGEYFEGYTPP